MRAGLTHSVRACIRKGGRAQNKSVRINKRLGDAARVTTEAIKRRLPPSGRGRLGRSG